MSVHDELRALAGTPIQVWPGAPYEVQTQGFDLDRGNLDRAGDFFSAHLPEGPWLMIQDANTARVAGQGVLRGLKGSGCSVWVHTLEVEGGEALHATDRRVEEVEEALEKVEGCVGLIACGSGTLNDLGKLASHRRGIPYGVVATAASMNGYTSAIAAIMEGGIKRTLPCTPPIAALADLEVVAQAPQDLTLAGLGDLLSKPVSSGDWRLAHTLLDEPFSEAPLKLVDRAFGKVQRAAKGIGQGDPEAVGQLLQALMLSGISMASAGTSSPASGGEHLISHYWDMTAPYRDRKLNLHGAQVGVTTLISATLYQHLRGRRPSEEDIEARLAKLKPFETYAQGLKACPEALREGIRRESEKKYPTRETLRGRLGSLSQGWDELWGALEPGLQPPERLRGVLEAAGAPCSAAALGIDEGELREAFRRARDIRARYTVLDFTWELGHLEALEDVVLRESGVLGS